MKYPIHTALNYVLCHLILLGGLNSIAGRISIDWGKIKIVLLLYQMTINYVFCSFYPTLFVFIEKLQT